MASAHLRICVVLLLRFDNLDASYLCFRLHIMHNVDTVLVLGPSAVRWHAAVILTLLHHSSLIKVRPYVDQGSIKSITKLGLCREISLFKLLSCQKCLISPSLVCSIDRALHFSINIPKFASVSSNRGYGRLVLKMCREVFFSIYSMEI